MVTGNGINWYGGPVVNNKNGIVVSSAPTSLEYNNPGCDIQRNETISTLFPKIEASERVLPMLCHHHSIGAKTPSGENLLLLLAFIPYDE